MIRIIDDSFCEVTPLDTSIDPFGLITINSSTYHINSPSFVLKFGLNLTTEYIGEDIARGINVQKWQSCLYFNDTQFTTKFTWTFTGIIRTHNLKN
jgi:hypothetical protein